MHNCEMLGCRGVFTVHSGNLMFLPPLSFHPTYQRKHHSRKETPQVGTCKSEAAPAGRCGTCSLGPDEVENRARFFNVCFMDTKNKR